MSAASYYKASWHMGDSKQVDVKARAPRPHTVAFCEADLVARLKYFAALRNQGWNWDASLYPSLSRNAVPNVAGLLAHAGPLK